ETVVLLADKVDDLAEFQVLHAAKQDNYHTVLSCATTEWKGASKGSIPPKPVVSNLLILGKLAPRFSVKWFHTYLAA
ncbi:MAG TPA: hypothetical protein VGM73_12320, partial [Candidatus Didemnitutus sp.]